VKKRTTSAFASIAARIETEVGSPAALLVTSALESDGTTMIAARLAEALVAEGYRVAVVDARETVEFEASASALSYGSEIAEPSRTFAEIALRDLGDRFGGSRRDVSALIARLRARYDYIVVDAPAFHRGAMPTLFADVCDALMVAVQKGRSATAEDRRINSYLEGSTKHTIGIVTTTKAAISNFAASAPHRPRFLVPLHDIVEDRAGRVSIIAGSL
jgi:NAD(P)-dependent dehydrogenase (short-subunit alcohol dehydrogenase family)